MSNEERVAYLQETIRRAAPGSARRVWAEAQLAQLAGSAQAPQGAHGKAKPSTRRTDGR